MVNQAKAETKRYETLLKEANGKIEVLQAEVQALKQLVLTSTPNTPNKHLYPQFNNNPQKSHSRQSSLNHQQINQIISQTNQPMSTYKPNATSTPSSSSNVSCTTQESKSYVSAKTEKIIAPQSAVTLPAHPQSKEKISLFKSHKRVPSHNDIQTQSKSFIDKIFLTSSTSLHQIKKGSQSPPINSVSVCVNDENLDDDESEDFTEIDPVYFKEIIEWKENPEITFSSEFMKRIYQEDVNLCLDFQDKKVNRLNL